MLRWACGYEIENKMRVDAMRRLLSLVLAAGLLTAFGLEARAQDSTATPPVDQEEVTPPADMEQDVDMDTEMEMEVEANADENQDWSADNGFTQWDANQSGSMDDEEVGRTGFFDRWNTDNVDGLTRREFGEGYRELGLFDEWATDNSVMRDRFGFANDEWFATWDSDANQELSRLEFTSGAFEMWDANDDGLLDADELNQGVVSAWDQDESGDWSSGEFFDASVWFDDATPETNMR